MQPFLNSWHFPLMIAQGLVLLANIAVVIYAKKTFKKVHEERLKYAETWSRQPVLDGAPRIDSKTTLTGFGLPRPHRIEMIDTAEGRLPFLIDDDNKVAGQLGENVIPFERPGETVAGEILKHWKATAKERRTSDGKPFDTSIDNPYRLR